MSESFPAGLSELRAGSVAAGYRLDAQIGAGGMAVVFRARDERLGRMVALKILAPTLAADPAFRRRFVAESRAAATVDHPHIIPIYEAGEASGALFIAMRFVPGGDLRGVLNREGVLSPTRAAGFISPVASALDAAHRAGLVHRDVKPANILVDAHQDGPDHVYLSDFGVSKGAISSVSLTGAGHFLGTPDYSAPEQIQGRAVDGRADQYALACVAYQLLTGAVPFQRDQGMAVLLAHLSEPPPSLAARRPGLPAAADRVLARALAKVPEKRFGSCADFADALREALGLSYYTSLGPVASADGAAPRSSTSPQSYWSAAALTVDGVADGAGVRPPTASAEEGGPADDPARHRRPSRLERAPSGPRRSKVSGGPGHARSRSRSTGPARSRWRTPVVAAVALAAAATAVVAGILLTANHPGPGSTTPGTSATALGHRPGTSASSGAAGLTYALGGRVPPYYVWITPGVNSGSTPSRAQVRLTATGAVLGTIYAATPGGTINAVTSAANDRMFVLDEQVFASPNTNAQQAFEPRTFYLLRLSASGRPASVTRLPITEPSGAGVTGVALSPDGTLLAVAVQPNNVKSEPNLTELKLYSVATGAVVRTWYGLGEIGTNEDDPEALTWAADQQTLAFFWANNGASPTQGEWVLDLGAPGTDLLEDSSQAMRLDTAWSPEPSLPGVSCQNDMVLTPDGSAVVCGTVAILSSDPTQRTAETAFLEYSPADGQIMRILAHWTLPNAGVTSADVLWSNPSGSVLIGEIPTTGDGQVGMITASGFTPLPGLGSPSVAVLDQAAW